MTKKAFTFVAETVALIVLGYFISRMGTAWYHNCRDRGGTKQACGGMLGEHFGR